MLPTWEDASVSFLKSGGFQVSSKVPLVGKKTLVIWGADDVIISPESASKFQQTLPDCELVIIDNCGHAPHIERAEDTAFAIKNFLEKYDQ